MLFRSASGTMQIVDVTSSTAPTVTGSVTLGYNSSPRGISVQGRYAYVVTAQTANSRLFAIDVSDPTSPTIVNSVNGFYSGLSPLIIQGRYAYSLALTGLRFVVFDIGGAHIQQLEAGGIEASEINVRSQLTASDGNFTDSVVIGEGGLAINGVLGVSASSTSSTAKFINHAANTYGTDWGAYIDQLLVGSNPSATGTQNYEMAINYSGSTNFFGLCLDNVNTATTCPTTGGTTFSILADDGVSASAFDLAEMYSINGPAAPGDVLVLDSASSSTVAVSSGVPYDKKVIGVVSTKPGLLLGWTEGAQVAGKPGHRYRYFSGCHATYERSHGHGCRAGSTHREGQFQRRTQL